MEEIWYSTDWKLDLRRRMLQKSRVKVLEEVSRHPSSSAEEQSDLGISVVPSPDGDSEATGKHWNSLLESVFPLFYDLNSFV